ncbi:MAG: sensor domain-containing diguanylate cyclase [Candidatus Omnitrophica bacterium]|nr:sensor domain-containing diguanylate cyclase [Candidatus Omnitrophota bacterium]
MWRDYKKRHDSDFKIQNLEEKINIIIDQNSNEFRNKVALQEKISRYDNLKNSIEKISQNLTLDSVADILVTVSFSLVSNNKGVCILYLIDSSTHKPTLFKTRKEDKNLIIKTKEGDMFDLWVLKHTSPLLIEDTRKDFRFDLEKMKVHEERTVSSLISSPLISDSKFLGILRLDNSQAGSYMQHDLRLLATICDFGALALENSELFQKTQELAIRDGLTALYTKGYFLDRLKEECKRSVRQNEALSLLMLDIDYFKNYNDKFGHTAGDIVLRSLSQNISSFLEEHTPVISRFGGEEFCIILPRIGKNKACTIAEQLRARIENTKIILRRQKTHISVSIGVASCPADASEEEQLIYKADRAMYEAKQKGRNLVVMA